MISFTATLPQLSWPSHMGNLRVGTTILMSSLSSAVSIVSALPSVPAYGKSTFIHGCGTTFPITHPFHTSYLSRYVPGYLKELQDGHAEELALFKMHLEDVRQQVVRSSSFSFPSRPHFDLPDRV